MKRELFVWIGALAVSFITFGCNSSQHKENTNGQEKQEVFACMDSITMVCDSMKLTWIRDNAQEHKMPLNLFGKLPQELIDSIGIADGIPSSMSAFLLETNGKRILFDTGMGAPDSQLEASLSAAGITPHRH